MIQNPVYYPFTNIIRDNDRRVSRQYIGLREQGQTEWKVADTSIDYEDFERKIVQETYKTVYPVQSS